MRRQGIFAICDTDQGLLFLIWENSLRLIRPANQEKRGKGNGQVNVCLSDKCWTWIKKTHTRVTQRYHLSHLSVCQRSTNVVTDSPVSVWTSHCDHCPVVIENVTIWGTWVPQSVTRVMIPWSWDQVLCWAPCSARNLFLPLPACCSPSLCSHSPSLK